MRELKIDLYELDLAFSSGMDLIAFYLDLETGEVINITDEIRSLWESLSETYYNKQTQTVDWEAAFQAEHIPEWEVEAIKDADRVDEGFGERFIAIPQEESREGYGDMVAFIATVRSPHLQERLERSIHGRGAFRYFKDVLLEYPAERERWFQFQQERRQERMLDWLEGEGITPVS